MAVEPAVQGKGLGRYMMVALLERVGAVDADLIWATARPSAVGFYQRCRFEVGEEMTIQPTRATMHYVWRVLNVTPDSRSGVTASMCEGHRTKP
jgi:GNAT superfamily N-acetyltransferase